MHSLPRYSIGHWHNVALRIINIIIPQTCQKVRLRIAEMVCCAILANTLFTASPAFSQESPAVTGAPSLVVGGAGSASPTPEEIFTKPTVQTPNSPVPPPLAPSEPPSGFISQPVPPPVLDTGDSFIYVEEPSGCVRTIYDNGKPELTTAEGNVTIKFRNTVTTAKSARIDYNTNIAVMAGGVVFKIDGEQITGEELTLNLKTKEWALLKAKTTVEPQYAKGYLCAPVFAKGAEIEGVGQKSVTAIDSETTTCNLPYPHYELKSRSVTVYPGRRIVLRHATAYVLGHRLFTLPKLVIPLLHYQQNPTLIPRFGQSQQEGFFMKSTYAYTGTATQAGFLLLDLMSKKGIGTGIRQTYQLNTGQGDLQIYRLQDRTIDQSTLTGQFNHAQTFAGMNLKMSSSLRNNSYLYAPQSRSLNNQLSLTRDRADSNASLIVSQGTDTVLTQTRRLNGNLTYRQFFGNKITMSNNFIYTSYGSTGNPRAARLDSQSTFSRSESKFDWSLSAEKLTDMSAEGFIGSGQFAGVEKLPEIALMSDSKRIKHALPFGIPAQYKLSFGQYNELPAATDLSRTYMEVSTPTAQHKITDTMCLAAGGGFRQFVYSNNTAMYSVDANASLTKKLGQCSTAALTYRLQQPRGFTPYRFDFLGKYNVVNGSLNLQETDRFKLSLLSGYNFEQKKFPWQDATLRMSVKPTPSVLLYTSTGYDINRSKWRTLINQLRIRNGEKFRLDLGTRYDATLKKLVLVKPVVDAYVDRKTRIQAAASYNGQTKSFNYKSIMLTRDLHCWEASVVYTNQTGFYTENSVMVYLRIKAFPVFRQFGIGQFGQAEDSSVGEVY